MDPSTKNRYIDVLTTEILPQYIETILRTQSSGNIDPDGIYHRALDALVDRLLCSGNDSAVRNPVFNRGLSKEQAAVLNNQMGELSPQEVGELYERLRGYRLELGPRNEPLVTQSAHTRRNQGLFYTPIPVVRHIVEQTLDAIDTGNAENYLDVRVLDPSVGTGVFLGEILEQLLKRVMSDSAHRGQIKSRIRALKDEHATAPEVFSRGDEVDDETLVRIHLVKRCLYGVDLDPIAVRIARSHLLKKALRDSPAPSSLTRDVRVGNSLIGAGRPSSPSDVWQTDPDSEHIAAYFGRIQPDRETVKRWKEATGVFHWPMEYPEIFDLGCHGFDAVVGNPPYEILSVKESGIDERRRQQSYYRRMYRTCQGKINTYRLMLERGLALLRPGGVLGFIVPATLLADSTARSLRRLIFDETEILQAVVIPEKARLFDGVTQALLILVVKKGGSTLSVNPTYWDGSGPVIEREETRVPLELIKERDFRVPLLRSAEEKALLEILSRYPPFRGVGMLPAAGAIHQGEINLTVQRRYIATKPTAMPLIRGEHVEPFQVVHPSARAGRLDWVRPEFLADRSPRTVSPDRHEDRRSSGFPTNVGKPWEKSRIAVGRVVNMATATRLKAAPVPSGSFLGDMTNSITDFAVPENYLLGLLNSSLLNWRIKLTSTNNYLSAAEIEALPIPRILPAQGNGVEYAGLRHFLDEFVARRPPTLMEAVALLDRLPVQGSTEQASYFLGLMIEWVTERIRADIRNTSTTSPAVHSNALEALVLSLYAAVPYAIVVQKND